MTGAASGGPVQDPSAVLHVFFAEAVELVDPPLAALATLRQLQCHWYIGDTHTSSNVFSFSESPETVDINFRSFLVTDVGADASLSFTIATEDGDHLAAKFGRLHDMAQSEQFEVRTFELCNTEGVLTQLTVHCAVQPRWTLGSAAVHTPGDVVFIDGDDAQASYVVGHIFPEPERAEEEEKDNEENEATQQKTNVVASTSGSQEHSAPTSVADKSRMVDHVAVESDKAATTASVSDAASRPPTTTCKGFAAAVGAEAEEEDLEEGWYWEEGGEEEELEKDEIVTATDEEDVQAAKRGSRSSISSKRSSLKSRAARGRSASPSTSHDAAVRLKSIGCEGDLATPRSSVTSRRASAVSRRRSACAKSNLAAKEAKQEQEALTAAARLFAVPAAHQAPPSSESHTSEQPQRRGSGRRASKTQLQVSEGSGEHESSAARQTSAASSEPACSHRRPSDDRSKARPETSSVVHQPHAEEKSARVSERKSPRNSIGMESSSSARPESQWHDDGISRYPSRKEHRLGDPAGRRVISRGQVSERPVSRREQMDHFYPPELSGHSSSGSSSNGSPSAARREERTRSSARSASHHHASSSNHLQDAERAQKDMLLANDGPFSLSGGLQEFEGEMQHRRMALKSKMRVAKARETAAAELQRSRDSPKKFKARGGAAAKACWAVDSSKGRFFRVEAQAISARCRPDIDAAQSKQELLHGDVFKAVSSKLSGDGFVYLQLAHDRGWVFNDARVHAVHVVDDTEPAPSDTHVASNGEASAPRPALQDFPDMSSEDGTFGTGPRTAEGTPSSVTSRSLTRLQRVADDCFSHGLAAGVHQPTHEPPKHGTPQQALQRPRRQNVPQAMGVEPVPAKFENYISPLNSARSFASDRIGQNLSHGSTQALHPRHAHHGQVSHHAETFPLTAAMQFQPWPQASTQWQRSAVGPQSMQHAAERAAPRMHGQPSPLESGFGTSPTTDGWLTPAGGQASSLTPRDVRFEVAPDQGRASTPRDVQGFGEVLPGPSARMPRHTAPWGAMTEAHSRPGSCSPEKRTGASPHLSTSFLDALRGGCAPAPTTLSPPL